MEQRGRISSLNLLATLNRGDSLSRLRHWWGSQRGWPALCKTDLPCLQDSEALASYSGTNSIATEFCFADCVANGGFNHQASTLHLVSFSRKLSEYGHVVEFAGHNIELLHLLPFMENAGRSKANFDFSSSSSSACYVSLSAQERPLFCLWNWLAKNCSSWCIIGIFYRFQDCF